MHNISCIFLIWGEVHSRIQIDMMSSAVSTMPGLVTLHRATLNRVTVNRRQFTGRHLTAATVNRSDR